MKHKLHRYQLAMALPILGAATLFAAGTASAATYTWFGTVDSNWNNSANWDASGVPVDSKAGTGANNGVSLAGIGDQIVFSGSIMPTSNIPGLGGTSVTIEGNNTPIVALNSGGTITLNLVGDLSGGYIRYNSTTVLTVGDGTGSSSNSTGVVLNMSAGDMVRHNNNITNTFVINSDGIWNLTTSSLRTEYANRYAHITLAGGTMNLSGFVNANFAVVNATTADYFDFTAVGATFTGAYGGQFTDLTSVSAAIGNTQIFRSTSNLTLAASDLGGSRFMVTVIPEPSTAVLGAIGVICLLRRRR